ncbi:MAG: PaaI family thioesterase [Flavobacteriales bacterium]
MPLDDVARANELGQGTLMEALGMRFERIEPGLIVGTMPVDARTHQPYGLLHGGASAALAETLGSFGSHYIVQVDGGIAVGVDLQIHHLKSKRFGAVRGEAKIIHQGKSLHVWNIDISDAEEGSLISTARLTVIVKQGKQP